ncbi:MAG: 16S rRNA (cytosine(967)-C(5))-methyltransferase RsmB [Acidobacteriota bacterium]|nr:16S rRNA (cytosine(967)-C(5))-methyltransferase RsmB [Acidobacteriota bacterium]
MKISPARVAAFEVLTKIERDRAFSSVLLPIAEERLEAKDRALCHALTLGILRKQLYLDRIIKKLTEGKKLDSAVKIILRIGLYQLIHLDKVPAHAAINDSVNLVRQAKKTSASGFVNAILRRFTREKLELNFIDEIERVAMETSHPRWLIERWIREFGLQETVKLASINNETPISVFRLTRKSDENTIGTLRKLDLEISESSIVEDAWKVTNSNEMLRLYAGEGKIYFQDEASQLVAQTVGLKEGESFLDVCAAPGSKATFVARQARRKVKGKRQKLIVAGDFHDHRIKILQANCRRQGADFIEIVRYDAEVNLPFADESFDVVLVDAPCSGTGTIRHNPEIRYFLREDDFAELADKQLRIVQNASKLVSRGGRLIYSTCSLEREENEAVGDKFLSENQEFDKVAPKVSGRFATTEDFARTLPQRDETDGFFIAVFEKKRVFGKV